MKKRSVGALIQAIDDRLDEELPVEAIAQMGFVSPMQLYRDFYSATGHTVKEYQRKRRLSKALALLSHSDMPPYDIAYECGYSSQQAFCRSVKAATGQTPLSYKQSGAYFYFPRYTGQSSLQIRVEAGTLPETAGFAFFDRQLSGIENRAVESLLSLLPDYEGRLFGRNGKQAGPRFCYELYLQADASMRKALRASSFQPLEDVPQRAGLFAKAIVKNVESQINAAWNHLADAWLHASMFEHSDEAYFEEYILKNRKISRLQLFLPVKRRQGIMNIRLLHRPESHYLACREHGPNAENEAAQAVMQHLSVHHPGLIQSARSFFVSRDNGAYTCGIRLDQTLDLKPESRLTVCTVPAGKYAVIESDCCHDALYGEMLKTWAQENGFALDGEPFALYEAGDGFAVKQIHMSTYIKLKKW